MTEAANLSAPRNSDMSTKPIRLVIAGLGAIALNQYLPQIREMHGVEVVAACDPRNGWAERQCAQLGIPHAFTDVATMLAAVKADALVNLTSIPAHFSVNLAALQSGLHV